MRGNYTLLDTEYQNALTLVCSEFAGAGIEYAVIGGGAVQIQLLHSGLDGEKLRGWLRKTGDIDVVVGAPLEEMVLLFNRLAACGAASNVRIGKPRVGPISINYLTAGELKGVDHQLSLRESEYKEIGGTQVRVEIPEMIIAAKLTGHVKLKDIRDIDALHCALSGTINEDKIIEFLVGLGRAEQINVYRNLTR